MKGTRYPPPLILSLANNAEVDERQVWTGTYRTLADGTAAGSSFAEDCSGGHHHYCTTACLRDWKHNIYASRRRATRSCEFSAATATSFVLLVLLPVVENFALWTTWPTNNVYELFEYILPQLVDLVFAFSCITSFSSSNSSN